MPEDLERRMRKLISEAEADIGFDRDAPVVRPVGSHAVREMMEFWYGPAIAAMRAVWQPVTRR